MSTWRPSHSPLGPPPTASPGLHLAITTASPARPASSAGNKPRRSSAADRQHRTSKRRVLVASACRHGPCRLFFQALIVAFLLCALGLVAYSLHIRLYSAPLKLRQLVVVSSSAHSVLPPLPAALPPPPSPSPFSLFFSSGSSLSRFQPLAAPLLCVARLPLQLCRCGSR